MKRILIGTALALFGLAPTIGSACEYNDATSASAAPRHSLQGRHLRPRARCPHRSWRRLRLFKQAKQVGDKTASPAPDAKTARVAANN